MITIIGSNPAEALRHAAQTAGIEARFYPSSIALDAQAKTASIEKQEEMRELQETRGLVFSVIDGNLDNALGMVPSPDMLNFVPSDSQDLATRFMKSMRKRVKVQLTELESLSKALPGRLVHLESPPPPPNEYMAEVLQDRMTNENNAGSIVPRAWLRNRLWRANSKLFKERCDALKIPFIPVPPEASDEKGFLKQEYWKDVSDNDPTHANEGYWALVLERVEACMAHSYAASV